MHLDIIGNGNGAQSLALIILAAKGKIRPRIAICGDTHWEDDRLWSDGTRASAAEYFNRIVKPYCDQHGINALMATTLRKDGSQFNLKEHTIKQITDGRFNNIKIPLFGSDGGRLKQSCTDVAKVRAVRQTVRRMGGTSFTGYRGIHILESQRRLKDYFTYKIEPLRLGDGFRIYPVITRKDKVKDGNRIYQKPVFSKWETACFPLVDLRMSREDCQALCTSAGLPYLITSECDDCPHQDIDRWDRHTPEHIDECAGLEAKMGGKFFFTAERIPLKGALIQLRTKRDRQPEAQPSLDFGCQSWTCGM